MSKRSLLVGLSLLILASCAVPQRRDPGADSASGTPIAKSAPPTNLPAAAPASSAPNNAPQPTGPQAPSISTTRLDLLFKVHPYDGTPATYFPRLAVTIVDWQQPKCWISKAKLWTGRNKSEDIGPFTVCFNKNMAWRLQSAEVGRQVEAQKSNDHSGNVRSQGPKPPQRALPDRIGYMDDPNAYWDFVHALAVATGWLPGAPTNLWIVGFDNGSPQKVGK